MQEVKTPTPQAPTPPPATSDQKDIEENKGLTVLSYIGILCLIPLLAKKESRFAQYHAKQGLVLFIAEIATSIIMAIPIIGWIIGFLAAIVWLILAIMGIMNTLQGQYKEIPVLGKFGTKFKF